MSMLLMLTELMLTEQGATDSAVLMLLPSGQTLVQCFQFRLKTFHRPCCLQVLS